METSYSNIENKLIKMKDINQVEEIVPLMVEEGIRLQDIEDIFEDRYICVGGMLMGCGDKIYLIKDLYDNISNFNNSIMTEMYLLDSQIKKMEPGKILRHFSGIPILQGTDKKILDIAYRIQWKQTYREILGRVEDSIKHNTEMDLGLIGTEESELPLIRDISDLMVYKRFYVGVMNSKEYLLVILEQSAGHTFQHIKLDLDINTGEVLLKVNGRPGKVGDYWRDLVLPIHALAPLLELAEGNPLKLTAQGVDLIPATNVGKVSGFKRGTKFDTMICEFLGIDEIYRRGTFMISDISEDDIEREIITAKKEVELEQYKDDTNWFN